MPIRDGDGATMILRFQKSPVNIAHIAEINQFAKQAGGGLTEIATALSLAG
jgi:hypothetical protein